MELQIYPSGGDACACDIGSMMEASEDHHTCFSLAVLSCNFTVGVDSSFAVQFLKPRMYLLLHDDLPENHRINECMLTPGLEDMRSNFNQKSMLPLSHILLSCLPLYCSLLGVCLSGTSVAQTALSSCHLQLI